MTFYSKAPSPYLRILGPYIHLDTLSSKGLDFLNVKIYDFRHKHDIKVLFKINLVFTSSWELFLYVPIFREYLNYWPFSNDLLTRFEHVWFEEQICNSLS